MSNKSDYINSVRACTIIERHSHEKQWDMRKGLGVSSPIFNIRTYTSVEFFNLFEKKYMYMFMFM